ncbi:MAG TPA: PilT/PilU family type 4a pilus ATPase [Candidatus Acidoferrales bacterium]|nr:PilT/PilU family type 4a pilus ATPase [Candidatus Acidoferrales bacterium]
MTAIPADVRLRDVVTHARLVNASDVHLQPGCVPTLRVDGSLVGLDRALVTAAEMQSLVEARLSPAQHAALERAGDLSLPWTDEELGATRAHLYRAAGGYVVALRLLERDIPGLESLELPEAVERLATLDRGLVIVGGATGSGKSTTVAALVDRINASRACRIVTVEDPIEYRYRNRRSVISQREVGRDTPHFAGALRGALRADPDVIVVGEMRDADAMRVALTAAETGHLVVTTLHTGDAPQTIDRVVDAFSGPAAVQVRAQLAAVLAAVVCQVLVKRNGRDGRRAAAEILIGTDAVRNLIRDAKTHQLRNAIATGARFGMQTLGQHLEQLERDGSIDAVDRTRIPTLPAESTAA